MCITFALLGRCVRTRLISAGIVKEPPKAVAPSCPGCGYCLIGLTKHVCPECGRPFTLEEMNITTEQLRPPDRTGDAGDRE